LPESRYVGVKEEIRKVSYDCLISFNGSRYSVPWQFAGKQVWIRVSKGYYLEAYSQANKLISRHKLSLKKGSVIIEQNHYRGNNLRGGNFQRLKNYFLEAFPDKVLFVEKLKAQKRINAQYQLHQIIELSKLFLQLLRLLFITTCFILPLLPVTWRITSNITLRSRPLKFPQTIKTIIFKGI
jgi:hypothetical protein